MYREMSHSTTIMNLISESAKKGYEAYRQHAGGTSPVTGAILPPWENTTEEIRLAWKCAAETILFQ